MAHQEKKRLKIGVLISGSGSNLQAIIDACESGLIDGEVVFVGSDVPDVKGLARAKKHHIPTFAVNYKEFMRAARSFDPAEKVLTESDSDFMKKSLHIVPRSITSDEDKIAWLYRRMAFEMILLEHMEQFDFDLLVLAGFMRNLTAFFIDQINTDPAKPLIMNIHPALLPSFPGTNGYEDTFNYGCKVGGSTVHFVDYGEDTGPIIGQITVPILPGDTLDNFKEKGLKQEWILYPQCIQLFAEGSLKVVTADNGRKKVQIG
ncbi:MAG: phosphoribosylglycinamide formyltransferase [Parcubacteria group bacterium]|jgi:phosphoribosylglycinamide formyltransferase-1